MDALEIPTDKRPPRVHWSPSTILRNPLRESDVDTGLSSVVGSRSSERGDVITKQPRRMTEEEIAERRTPRTREEELYVDSLNCLVSALCCPFFAVFFPFVCPKEYERVVIFRLGRVRSGGARGPGVFFTNPFLDEYLTVDMRIDSVDVPPQEVMTQDGVKIMVEAVVFYRVEDAISSCCNVFNFRAATLRMSESAVRAVLGKFSLSDVLERTSRISNELMVMLAESTLRWGVAVVHLEIKNLFLPGDLVRSMATEAETERLALATVELSKGEQAAAHQLSKASECLDSPAAIPLRSLESLVNIAQRSRSTALFPVPIPLDVWSWQ